MSQKIRGFIQSFPLWTRKFAIDTLDTFIAAVLVMSFAGFNEAGINALVVALGTATVAAARRNLPDALNWLRDVFGVAANLIR